MSISWSGSADRAPGWPCSSRTSSRPFRARSSCPSPASPRNGELSLFSALCWTTFGSVVGAWLLYALGSRLGHDRMRSTIARIPLLDVEDVDRTTAWFHRHGRKAVFFGRMLPLFRTFVSIPAGTERMSFPVFTLLTVLGSGIWNSAFIVAGYALGANWHRVEPYAAIFQYVVIAVAVGATAWFIYSRLRRRRTAAG